MDKYEQCITLDLRVGCLFSARAFTRADWLILFNLFLINYCEDCKTVQDFLIRFNLLYLHTTGGAIITGHPV